MTKPTKSHVRPAKTQISLGIHPVWSESSLCAWWVVAEDLSFLQVDSQDSDQTGWMPRLICFPRAHRSFVGFVMPWLILKKTIRFWMLFFSKKSKKKKKDSNTLIAFHMKKFVELFPCVKSLQLPIYLFSPIRVWVPTLVRVSGPLLFFFLFLNKNFES